MNYLRSDHICFENIGDPLVFTTPQRNNIMNGITPPDVDLDVIESPYGHDGVELDVQMNNKLTLKRVI